MILYHGSSIGGLKELKPFLSEHGKPYIYFTSNPVVALLYAVHPVDKPFSWYPYGFDADGTVVYSEYYPNAFADIYKGKTGYLYECDHVSNVNNPTNINCAYTCESPVPVCHSTKIDDLYTKFMDFQQEGKFHIRPLKDVSYNEMQFIMSDLKNTIEKHGLLKDPQCSMSLFIRTHFADIWNELIYNHK